MKNLLLLFLLSVFTQLGISQSTSNNSFWRNVEIYYSPFQTRIGSFEYEINKTNEKEASFGTYTSANVFKTNDAEIGVNYLFKIKKRDFGIGVSYFTDSYKFAFHTSLHDRLYRIKRRGLSLNIFYRAELFPGTTLDVGLNTRLPILGFSSNWREYSHIKVTSSLNVLVDESWGRSFPVEFVPSIQLNTNIHRRFYLRYGVYTKFWGKKFYSVVATEKINPEKTILDFNIIESSFKAVISVGYSFIK